MLLPTIPVWKQAPFLRMLISLITGILLQWNYSFSLKHLYSVALAVVILLVAASFLKGYWRYKHKWIFGVLLVVGVGIFGAWITHQKNIKHNRDWYGNVYADKCWVVAVLDEPPVEKNKSYKATARVCAISMGDSIVNVKGRIIVYFQKDSMLSPAMLHYGSVIVFSKTLQPIRNTGNPGAFDYSRYCLFQSITHQVFLAKKDVKPVYPGRGSTIQRLLQRSRGMLLHILKTYIHGKKELAVAEALLIGYREDLDRDLVQAYSNTGVVHIIAISGMHLALIYGLLIVLLKPLQRKSGPDWPRGIIMLLILWIFALLSGAGASILRSTIMFSFIIVGQCVNRQVSIYHTLSASAFFLLCYNPFYLWDVGFQLSYAAVLSIVVFGKPIANWFYFKNKIADYIWKLIAVTMAAQVLTTPLSIYHFHQVPNLFLVSNLLVVPMSGIVLYTELLLCTMAFVKPLAVGIGYVVSWMLQLMNAIISWINALPFAVSSNISMSVLQTILLYLFIVMIAGWLMQQKKGLVKYALFVLVMMVSLRSLEIVLNTSRHKVIVYNVPQHVAVDFVIGERYFFRGDEICCNDDFIKNFHLNPTRLVFGLKPLAQLSAAQPTDPFVYFCGRRVLLLDSLFTIPEQPKPIKVDLIILSKNVRCRIAKLSQVFDCNQYVFDASNSPWKTREWKNECDSLHLRRHSVEEQGAFVFEF